ncbi:MAG: prepilin-type N-terminal cleavage/methylation domain-containing protein [Planctomycetota bacterium]
MSRRHGFTLVEMLVVIAIISVLSALVLAALGTARRTANENATKAIIKLLEGALERYSTDFNDYPPSDGDETGIRGSENLWRCLRTEKKEGPYLRDGDIKTCDSNRNGEPEIADAWGRPIRYLHHHDYGSKNPRKHDFRLISAGPNGIYEEGHKTSDDIVNWDKNGPEAKDFGAAIPKPKHK